MKRVVLLQSFLRSLRGVFRKSCTAALCTSLFLSGCSTTAKKRVSDLQYLTEASPGNHYRGRESAIEHPCLDNVTAESVQVSQEPRSLSRRIDDEVREITLNECIRLAAENNDVIEEQAFSGIGQTRVLAGPEGVRTVYDSAIQETGILFGRRGLNAALSDFDTTFAASMLWGRDTQRRNIAGFPVNAAETGTFRSGLRKSLATGASIGVSQDWFYSGNSQTAPGGLPSTYTGQLGAEVRQPLLAGSGIDYTRIAGPVNPQLGPITGVSQGVVIARINQDVTIAEFETAIRNGIRSIENFYWDLYGSYRVYDTAVVAYESAFQTWREAQVREEAGALEQADELQARDRLYETRAQIELALSNLYSNEATLRVILGLPMNDGTVLRPIEEPVLAEFKPDWQGCLVDGLTSRPEIRRQKWQIKSLQLQLLAARSLVRPRLDAVGGYGVNGFGDRLLGQDVGLGGLPINNGFGSMTHDNLESWTLGMEMSMPIGFRQARSQVRNLELQLTRANAILAQQERRVAHEIASSIQNISAAWTAAQTNRRRMESAAERVALLEIKEEVGTTTLDLVLRAQASVAQAEASYYQQTVNYMKAICDLNTATGQLLEVHNVYLAEGLWNAAAYEDASMRASERAHGFDNRHLQAEPPEFVSPGPPGTVELRAPRVETAPAVPDDAERVSPDAIPEPLPAPASGIEADPQ